MNNFGIWINFRDGSFVWTWNGYPYIIDAPVRERKKYLRKFFETPRVSESLFSSKHWLNSIKAAKCHLNLVKYSISRSKDSKEIDCERRVLMEGAWFRWSLKRPGSRCDWNTTSFNKVNFKGKYFDSIFNPSTHQHKFGKLMQLVISINSITNVF